MPGQVGAALEALVELVETQRIDVGVVGMIDARIGRRGMKQQLAAEAAHHRALLGRVDAIVAGTGRQGQGLRDQLEVERAEDSLLRVAAFDVVEKPHRGGPNVRIVHVRYTARHEMHARTVEPVGPARL